MQFNKPIFGGLVSSLMVTVAAISAPAIAEEASLSIEEIIVTARKREESAQEVPVAMTALSAELRDSTVRNLRDVNGYSPNVVIRENTRANGTEITIRGVTASVSGEKSHDSPIAVSIDGVFMGTNSGRMVENFDLERIEIMRGPQGTLFGKNTVGGVINIHRSRPTGELGGKARVTAGQDGQQEIRALLNVPVTETLAAKLFYSSVESDGYLDRTFDGGKAPVKDYENFGISLLWEPSDRFNALLTLERYNNNGDAGANTNFNIPAGYYAAPTGADIGKVQDLSPGTIVCNVFADCRNDPETISTAVTTNQPNTGNYRNNVVSLTLNYDLNDNLTLVSVSGYHDTPYEDTISEFDAATVEFIYIDTDNVYEQFTQELRLEGSYDRFDFVVGGYYFENSYDQDWATIGSFWQTILGPLGTGLALDPATVALCATPGVFGQLLCDPRSAAAGNALGENFDQRLFQTQDTESLAFFGQIDYNVTDQLTATFGIRHTDEEKHFIGYQSYLGETANRYPFNKDVANFDGTNDWKETTIKAGLSYNWSDDVMFFASYSQGFKSGGFYGVNQNVSDFERNQYDPETANSYEVGMKGQFLDNRLQLNVTGFYNDFKDKQDSNVVADSTTATVATVWENIANLEYTGIEVETKFVATENLDIFATAGWLDSKYSGFESLNFIPIQDRTANSVPQNVDYLTPKRAPEWTFGLGGTYTQQLGPGEIVLHAKWNYVSEQETDTYNDPISQIPSQNFINASVGYEWSNFRLTVFGQNLTDEQVETAGFLIPFFGGGNVGPGRHVGAELELVF